MREVRELIERLENRAEEDEQCAANNARVVELLDPEMKLFDAREAPWNTYVVRMAVDHRSSERRDRRYAADLREAVAILRAKEQETR